MHIRLMEQDDLPHVEQIFFGLEDFFHARDLAVARHDFHRYLTGADPDVAYYVAENSEAEPPVAVLGYRRDWGAEGVYYLSHFGVAMKQRGQGIGREILSAVESHLRQQGARLVFAWTSMSDYAAPTRGFYESVGYEQVAVIPDYWRPGDPLAIYQKRFTD